MANVTATLSKVSSMVRSLGAVCLICVSVPGGLMASAASAETPRRLKVGTSVQLKDVTAEKMRYAKSVGIDYIEIGMSSIKMDLTGDKYVIQNKDEVIELVRQAKQAADDAGITIWSVHMPYGPKIDLSLPNEDERRKVVELQKEIALNFVSVLHPKIVLFHPSFFLPRSEMEPRKQQLIKSSTELDQVVNLIGAIMVLENMNDAHEQHMVLMQTTKDIVEMMNLVPHDIYSAVDLNHIGHPEQVIRALGKRVKTLHVSDGTGIQEKH
ncbi:TIM barrel protein [Edaphobacter sp. HDX4]|uniref:sugar phosphate isomerase/epimerase family protein n=1 Tax=Edaphobacter sp. HDX4 TaxID=2794064 RepID=UPI002FE65201